MNDSLRFCLLRLRKLQHDLDEKARTEAFDHRVRAAYFDASSNLSTQLGELDYLINLG